MTTNNKKAKRGVRYYLTEIDWAISRGLNVMLTQLITLGVLAIAIASLYLEALNIFEYEEILADLSNIEIIFFVAVLILIKRYISYCKTTSVSPFTAFLTPLIWYGRFIVITLLIVLMVFISDYLTETKIVETVIISEQIYDQLIGFVLVLLSVYISVPSKSLRPQALVEETPDIEPKFNSTHNTKHEFDTQKKPLETSKLAIEIASNEENIKNV